MTLDKAWIDERRKRNWQAERMLCTRCNARKHVQYLGETDGRLVYTCDACGTNWSVDVPDINE